MWRELALFTVVFVTVRSQGGTIFHCPDDKSTETFDLQCPGDTVIHIKEAIYGRNKWGACIYTSNDCTEKVDLTPECCGRQSCSVTIWKIYSINCTYVSFFRLIYECVQPEISLCGIPVGLIVTSPNYVESTESEKTVQITSSPVQRSDKPKVTQTQEVKNSKDVLVIVISAASVAFLMVAIIAVVFLLKRFQWQTEKQCILEFFIGMCKRHPPDGCENPDEERGRMPSSQPKNQSSSYSNSKNINNNNDKVKNLKLQQEIILKVVDKTLESDKILQEQNLRFCIPDIIPRRPKSILKNETNKAKSVRINTDANTDVELDTSCNIREVDLAKYKISGKIEECMNIGSHSDDEKNKTNFKDSLSVKNESETMVTVKEQTNKSEVATVVADVQENDKTGITHGMSENEHEETGSITNVTEDEHDETGSVANELDSKSGSEQNQKVKNTSADIADQLNCENKKANDKNAEFAGQFDYDGGIVVVDDLQLSKLRNDISVENLYGVGVERSNSYKSPLTYKNGQIVYYTDKVLPCRPKLLQRFGTHGTEINCTDSRTFRDITNSVVSEEPGTTAV